MSAEATPEATLQAILRAELKRLVDKDAERRASQGPETAIYAFGWKPGDLLPSYEADLRSIRGLKDRYQMHQKANNARNYTALATRLLERHGLPASMLGPLAFGLLDAQIKSLEVAEKRTLGIESWAVVPDSGHSTAPPSETARPEAAPPPAPPSLPLASALLASFQAWAVESAKWRGHSQRQAGVSFALFLEIVGDKPIDLYTPEDGDTFRSTLRKLPTVYRKSSKEKNKPIQQIIAETPPGPGKLSDKTVQRHFWAVSQFFEFLKETGKLPRDRHNPLRGFTFKTKGPARGERDMWSGAELERAVNSLNRGGFPDAV